MCLLRCNFVKIDSNIIFLSLSYSVKWSILFANITLSRQAIKQHQAKFDVTWKQQNKRQLLLRTSKHYILPLTYNGNMAFIGLMDVPKYYSLQRVSVVDGAGTLWERKRPEGNWSELRHKKTLKDIYPTSETIN